MNYKSLIMAVLAGALVATSCMKNLESASVTKVRDAKAEELKSLAELNKAQAAAATTLANAEASLKLAQAKVAEAQAAKLNAETEMLKAQLEYQIERYKQMIQDVIFHMELAAIQHQQDMEAAYAALILAMKEADTEQMKTVTFLLENIKNEDNTIQNLMKKIAAKEAKVVSLESELESIEEFTLNEVKAKRAEIASLQNQLEYYKECLTYDSVTLKSTIDAMSVDLMRINDERRYLADEKKEQTKSFENLRNVITNLDEENLGLDQKFEAAMESLKDLGPVVESGSDFVFYDENEEEIVLYTGSSIETSISSEEESVPAEFNVENITNFFELVAAEKAKALVASKVDTEPDLLFYFDEKYGCSMLDELFHDVTPPYASEWYEKQVSVVSAKLEEAKAEHAEAVKAAKEAKVVLDSASEVFNEATVAFQNAKPAVDWSAEPDVRAKMQKEVDNWDRKDGLAMTIQKAAADVQEYYETYLKAQAEFGKYNLEEAKEELRKATAAKELFVPVHQAAMDSVEVAKTLHGQAVTAVGKAQTALADAQTAYDKAKDAEYKAYVAHELADKETKAAKKTAYDEAKKETLKADEALTEAYTVLNKAKNAELKAKADLSAKQADQLAASVQLESLENLETEARETVKAAEKAAKNFAEAEEEMTKLEDALENAIAEASAYGIPEVISAYREAESSLKAAQVAYEEASSAESKAEGICEKLSDDCKFFAGRQSHFDDMLTTAQETYDVAMLALEEAGATIQNILDEDYDGYVAMVERLNTIAASYKETDALFKETTAAYDDLNDRLSALYTEMYGNDLDGLIRDGDFVHHSVKGLESIIEKIEKNIATLESEVDDLLKGVSQQEAIAKLKHQIENLKAELDAHQNILDTLKATLAEILGETEDSPVQE